MALQEPAEPDPNMPVFRAIEEEAIKAHFDEHGFVVVGGAVDEERVDATVDEVWTSQSLLGSYGLCRKDPKTWGGESWPAGSRNFLDPLDPCSEVETWRNRVAPAVARVFDILWHGLGTGEGEEALRPVVSIDRIGVMRPTLLPADDAVGDSHGWQERPEWRTSRNWLHFDQNPWSTPGFFSLQGLLGLSAGLDASEGGFVTVPRFHSEFKQWAQRHPEGSLPKRTASTIPFEVPLQDEMQRRRQKVLVPRGALLVWDSRMPHENFPNTGRGWRMVQYVTCKRLSSEGLQKRAAAWHAGLRTGLLPVAFAKRFSVDEQVRLAMAVAATTEGLEPLQKALDEGSGLSPEHLEAARQLRRAYRLKQTAIDPVMLMEARDLFRAAFAANPALREPLQRVAAAEGSYLPFWIL